MSRPSDKILDHLNSPRHAGRMESPDAVGQASRDGRAPRVTIYLRVEGTTVSKATFETFGCGYSVAACSVMMEAVTGKTISDCTKLTATDILEALDGVPRHKEFCARIALDALNNALSAVSENPIS